MDPGFANALKQLLDGGPPEVFVSQTVTSAGQVVGGDIRELLKGRVRIEQSGSAEKFLGLKVNKLGGYWP
jgi:hypothetical protein